MRSHSVVLLAVTAFGAACSQGYKQANGLAPTNARTIEVDVAGTPAAALQRVEAAAIDSGFVITNSAPGVVTIGPYQLRRDPGIKVTLHANIVGADSVSRVILSGTADDGFGQAIGRALAGKQGEQIAVGEPIVQATAGRNAWKWAELERWAAAIRHRP